MSEPVIADTGPLVAYFDRRDHLHPWAQSVLEEIPGPLWTCEPVLTEVSFLLRRGGIDPSLPLKMITQGGLRIAFELKNEIESVRKLMDRYQSLPMSLADASLVRMTEISSDSRLLTADSDFTVYRRNGRRLIPVLMPEIK